MVAAWASFPRPSSFCSIDEMIRHDARRAPMTFLYATDSRFRSSTVSSSPPPAPPAERATRSMNSTISSYRSACSASFALYTLSSLVGSAGDMAASSSSSSGHTEGYRVRARSSGSGRVFVEATRGGRRWGGDSFEAEAPPHSGLGGGWGPPVSVGGGHVAVQGGAERAVRRGERVRLVCRVVCRVGGRRCGGVDTWGGFRWVGMVFAVWWTVCDSGGCELGRSRPDRR
uniref:Uncharacterized protein n=1 Tax=Oryza brachyantha TaxID=4533 RepID=J3N8X4_ORYBR